MVNTREEQEICADVWNACCCVCFPVKLSAQPICCAQRATHCDICLHLGPQPIRLVPGSTPFLGRMLRCVLTAGAARDQGTLWTVTFLHSGRGSCIRTGTSTLGHGTTDPQCAQSSQSLRLLVTQNLYNKYINLNHFLWVNHCRLEPDSSDVCKMALLDAIYFCIKENNVDWSHRKNYKT